MPAHVTVDNGILALEPIPGGRISPAGNIKDVRQDHVSRYRWAAERLSGTVLDAGCNCGYGAAILADSGLQVIAVDSWKDGLLWAREHWDRPAIGWLEADLREYIVPSVDGVVAFEVIEHLANPAPFLCRARDVSPVLLASVPNQERYPWEPRMAPVHHRHYTRDEFAALLTGCGWKVTNWWGQKGPKSPVLPRVRGTTLVVECR